MNCLQVAHTAQFTCCHYCHTDMTFFFRNIPSQQYSQAKQTSSVWQLQTGVLIKNWTALGEVLSRSPPLNTSTWNQKKARNRKQSNPNLLQLSGREGIPAPLQITQLLLESTKGNTPHGEKETDLWAMQNANLYRLRIVFPTQNFSLEELYLYHFFFDCSFSIKI